MPTANEIFKKFLNNILFQGYLVTNEDKEKNIALDKSFIFILSKAELWGWYNLPLELPWCFWQKYINDHINISTL